MIVDCISDLHGNFPELPGGDLLIIAGDCTNNDSVYSWNEYFYWIDEQEYKRKIMIAGNHDNFCKDFALSNDDIYEQLVEMPSVTYLCDSGTDFEGLKVWGSSWTKTFPKMNPKCKAFTVDTEAELKDKFDLIPDDIDILITHSPPFGIMDKVAKDLKQVNVGSFHLRERIEKVRPRLHVFGHIHSGYGQCILKSQMIDPSKNVLCVNASHVDEVYDPVNKPVRIIL